MAERSFFTMTWSPLNPAPDRAAENGNQSIRRVRNQAVGLRGKRSVGKLSQRDGFSLAETLFCVMILAVTSSALISAITIATRQFETRTRESEQVFLCDTLTLAVQDQLTYVNEVHLASWDDVEGTGSLDWFKSGAVSSLLQRECRFAAVLYDEADDTYQPSGTGWGEIVMEYEGQYYQLTDYKNYAGRRGTGERELEASVEVKVVGRGTDAYFDVTIKVRPRSGATVPAMSQFTVTPVRPKVPGMD